MKKLFTTLLGATMAIGSLWAADNVPWSETFDSSSSISSWPKVYYNSSYSKQFQYTGGSLYMAQGYNNSSRHNEGIIFFSKDGFALDSSKSYKFEFDARHNSDTNSGNRKFEFRLYKKATSTLTFASTDYQVLYTNDNNYGYDWGTYSFFFEPETSGNYYLGLYYYADYAARASYWDNFKLAEGSMDAPDGATIEVTPDATGVLKANVKITAPIKNIRGNAITSIEKMVVYRDGGENETNNKAYKTESPLEDGTYTFAVAAKYTMGESKVVPVEITIDRSGVTTAIAQGVHVFGGQGCIHISGAEGMTVAVSNLDGVMIANGVMSDTSRIAAAKGVYIVNVDGKTYKVMVK